MITILETVGGALLEAATIALFVFALLLFAAVMGAA
jgi:hypothetical protein